MELTGGTRVAGVIGWPVRHSLSPAILNAAFEALGLDWVFVAFATPPDSGGAAITAVRSLGLGGLSVTMPHKAAAAAAVETRTAVADALEAVNCVFWDSDRLGGDNTDADGFLDGLHEDPGVDPDGLVCAVVGAGGAGRAVAWALGRAGAAEVVIVNRSSAPAEKAAALVPHGAGRVGRHDDLAGADLVVNATPLGMGAANDSGDESLPMDPAVLGPGQVVVDLIYQPEVTPLLAEARGRGAVGVNGLGMLVHQASRALYRWTGVTATPHVIGVMRAAALDALRRRFDDRPVDGAT
jgi:shikimate dehydrogenase